MILPLLTLLACTPEDLPDDLTVVDRVPGERAPLTGACDPLDANRCLLPWPSSTFSVADESSPTGIRVQVSPTSLPVEDSVDWLNRSDGFSRISGVVAEFDTVVPDDVVSWDPAASLGADNVLQVIVAEPDHPRYAERIAFRTEVRDGSLVTSDRSLLIGRPVQVMPASAEHVAVILDDVGEEAPHLVRVALGLTEPETAEEAAIAGYHAPTRMVLDDAGVDLDRVVRVWDFTTRSQGDATFRMHAMIDALDAAVDDLGIEIDFVVLEPDPEVAAIVRGRLTNAPSFLADDQRLELDEAGVPVITGTADIEFRVSVPAGEGDYRLVLYGHGTGGDVNDDAFDRDLAGEGIAKLNLRFDGWTGEDFVETLVEFSTFLEGSERSTSGLMEALAGGTVLLTALDGVLGDTLAGDTLAGEPNPAAGRRVKTDHIAWVGGSMGGTMGAVVVSADPRLTTAVLNVPGAGWTHMVPYSLLYASGMESLMSEVYADPLDLQLAIVMAQGNWDDVDGAVWAEEALDVGGAFLLQQSMEDPVLPNLGTELLATSLDAVQIEPILQPIVGLESTTEPVVDGAALMQFRVPNTGQYDVHGFAARNTPARDAALEQILHFLDTAWGSSPEMIYPQGCQLTDDDSCDFSGMWE